MSVTSGCAVRLGEISQTCSDLHDRIQLGNANDIRLVSDVLDELCTQVASLAATLEEMESARVERSLR